MLALLDPIKSRLVALPALGGFDVRADTADVDTTIVPSASVRASGASAADSETVAVTLEPAYTVTLVVKRSATAAQELDAALRAAVGALHNWRPGAVGGGQWQRMALQGVRPAEFSSTGLAGYELIFTTAAVYHGCPTGA